MSTLAPTPYPELNQVLATLLARIQALLGDDFVGLYLQGSFAVGDFDEHSDVDFIVVLERELTAKQVAALQEIHDQVYQLESSWAQHLEGSYFPREILFHNRNQGRQLWYLDNGARSLIRANHCNTIVVRWVVRERGLTLAGPPPRSLVETISPEVLRADIYATIQDWGQEILANPARFANRFYQGYLVLNYCRMFHDLVNGAVGSKRSGAEWAKATLDPRWVGLIDGGWSGRPDPAFTVRQAADPVAYAETLKFVAYVMAESRRIYNPLRGIRHW